MKRFQDYFASGRIVVTLSVATLYLSVGASYGTPISLTLSATVSTIGGGNNSGSLPPGPGATLMLRAQTTTPFESFQLEAPEPRDIEELIHFDPNTAPVSSWTIRKEDSANYGFDWDLFEKQLTGESASVRLSFAIGPYGTFATTTLRDALLATGMNLPKHPFVRDFAMDEIRIFVDYYYFHPLIPALRATKIGFEISGIGEVVPEPGAIYLLTIGALAWILHAMRRPARC